MVDWMIILSALIAIESGGDLNARGDNGRSLGQLQISRAVVKDVNRVYGTNYKYKDVLSKKKSKTICIFYLRYWGAKYEKKTGMMVTYEVYVRIWNGGPNGWRKSSTLEHWSKVKIQIDNKVEERRLIGLDTSLYAKN